MGLMGMVDVFQRCVSEASIPQSIFWSVDSEWRVVYYIIICYTIFIVPKVFLSSSYILESHSNLVRSCKLNVANIFVSNNS